MIIWITGISGAGKTTLGKALFSKFKKKNNSTIYLDGDQIRNIFNKDLNYSLKDRNLNAERLTKLVKYLSEQKKNIIISANLTSTKYRTWCRKNLKNYCEIYIFADLKNLIKRDYKGLYRKSLKGKIKNVVGVDLKFCHPKSSDIYLENNSSKSDFLRNLRKINYCLKKKKIKIY
tara:strand:+ start:589 stop:1113 length:525 start_codon:yes stop_codon:yes gene_type:complete